MRIFPAQLSPWLGGFGWHLASIGRVVRILCQCSLLPTGIDVLRPPQTETAPSLVKHTGNMSALKVILFLGSVRENRLGMRVAKFMQKQLEDTNHQVTLFGKGNIAVFTAPAAV